MFTKRYRNDSDKNVKFKIWGDPNMPPAEYDVAPGEECDIPAGYAAGSFVSRRAPGLVPADTPRPVAAEPEPAPEPEPEPEKAEEKPAEEEKPLPSFAKKRRKRRGD